MTQRETDLFPAIAYPLVVTRDGTIHLCLDLWLRSWHSGAVVAGVARNRSHVGVCWIGNYMPSYAQCRGMGRALAWLEWQLGRRLEVEGHKDSMATQCPGPTWPGWLPDVLAARDHIRSLM